MLTQKNAYAIHKKGLNTVHKQLIENNNVLMQKNAFNMHKKAFIKVHKQLIENNNLQMQKNAYAIHKKAVNNALMQKNQWIRCRI